MSTSCQSLGFNVPADKATLDEINEKLTSVSNSIIKLAPHLDPNKNNTEGEVTTE